MGKVILVTGGSRGIGAETCRQAAAAGYSVAINYRSNSAAATDLVAELSANGTTAQMFRADVSREEDVVNLFNRVAETLGTPTAVVNSAGIDTAHMETIDFDVNALYDLMHINVIGTMLCCREAARHMSTTRGGNGGAIVNVSSMAGTIGGRPGHSAYAASKAAVDSFTVGFAKEMGTQGIRVNAIRPGVTLTEMTRAMQNDTEVQSAVEASIAMNRVANTNEIASPILWLLSGDASFISGCTLDASGGGFVVSASTTKR